MSCCNDSNTASTNSNNAGCTCFCGCCKCCTGSGAASGCPTAGLNEFEQRLVHRLITLALDEDDGCGIGDITTLSTIPADSRSEARFLAKEDGVLSGLGIADIIFYRVHSELKVQWTAKDGDKISKGTYFGTVAGPTRALLVAERLVLNVMQRMSGIATFSSHLVSLISSTPSRHHKRPTRLLDTRKTAPGMRVLDKLAVKHCGAYNHRIGLFDMILIKDNHISASGDIIAAIERANNYLKQQPNLSSTAIEVETRTLDEVRTAVQHGGFQRIMLDNMVKVTTDSSGAAAVDCSMLRDALDIIDGKFETEASGNVTAASIKAISECGVDYISCGALTHSVKALDISMKIAEIKQ